MASKLVAPLLRAHQASSSANGHGGFIPQARKLVFEYCDTYASSANLRTYIHNHLEHLARANPHVEFVVKQRSNREPIIRGFYSECPTSSRYTLTSHTPACHAVNNRDKVIGLKGYEVNGIANKVQLLLDSSGAKIKPLKRLTVESRTEAARGIWSGLHVEERFRI